MWDPYQTQKYRVLQSAVILCYLKTLSIAKFIYSRWWKDKYGTIVEWYWHEEKEVLGVKPGPVPVCSPQIIQGLEEDSIQPSAVWYWTLTLWDMTRPRNSYCFSVWYRVYIQHWVFRVWFVSCLDKNEYEFHFTGSVWR